MNSERIYVGIILKTDGWYKFFTDGNKNYSYEKFDLISDVQIPDQNRNDNTKHTL